MMIRGGAELDKLADIYGIRRARLETDDELRGRLRDTILRPPPYREAPPSRRRRRVNWRDNRLLLAVAIAAASGYAVLTHLILENLP